MSNDNNYSKGVFYFQAQTGLWKVKKSALPSNYHTYALPFTLLGKVQLAVNAATVGTGGLVYEDGFLRWCAANDQGDK